MALKRMITKLALAFAAKKGMEAFRSVGGIDGVKSMLSGTPQADGMPEHSGPTHGHGRVGGTMASNTGGLGSLLDSLGFGGTTNGTEAGMTGQMASRNQFLGGLFGALAGAMNGQMQPTTTRHAMEDQLADENVEGDEDAKSVLRAMVHMARADGGIEDSEYDALLDVLDDASEEERDVLRQSMREPVDPQSIAADTPAHARKEVYSAALLVGEPDKPAEKTFLRKLADHLGLDASEVSRLHAAMGKPSV